MAAAFGALMFAASSAAEDAVIHAGYVLAKPGEGYLTRQTILVEDGRIVSITAGYSKPRDYTVINLRDLHDALDECFYLKGGLKYLYTLFPGGPIAQSCRLAGLKAPFMATDRGFGSVA
jgi:hypothetical protein